MEEEDRTIAVCQGARHRGVFHVLRRLAIVPIVTRRAPEHLLVAELLERGAHAWILCTGAKRRTEPWRRVALADRFNCTGGRLNVFNKSRLCQEIHLGVIVRVITNQVSVICNAPSLIRECLSPAALHKEGAANLKRPERLTQSILRPD